MGNSTAILNLKINIFHGEKYLQANLGRKGEKIPPKSVRQKFAIQFCPLERGESGCGDGTVLL
jgi:hypothetical protein